MEGRGTPLLPATATLPTVERRDMSQEGKEVPRARSVRRSWVGHASCEDRLVDREIVFRGDLPWVGVPLRVLVRSKVLMLEAPRTRQSGLRDLR